MYLCITIYNNHIMKSYFLLFLLFCVDYSAYAQYNKINVDTRPENMTIYHVDERDNSTLVFFKYTREEGIDWANIGENTIVRVDGTYKEYHLINSINMPINFEGEQHFMLFERPNQIHCFALEFEKFPLGVTFDIIEDEQSPSAYNFHGIVVDTTQIDEFINLDKIVEDYPIVREKIMSIKDGILFQTIKTKDIAITMNVQGLKKYGKYFMVNMTIQNYSGKSILFDLNKVSATGYTIKEGKIEQTIPLEILSADEYDKKIANRQAWSKAGVAFGEGMAAYNAGHSNSSTTYNGSSRTSVSANANSNSGSTYSYANAYGYSKTSTHGNSNTSSYNGAAAYEARQKAEEKVQQFASEQKQIREQLYESYVKTNTIANQEEYSGYFNIKFKKIDNLNVTFKICGCEFPFFI